MQQNSSSLQLFQHDTLSNLNNSLWIGDVVFITYDDCVDYYDGRTFDEIWADGSSFNYTLLDYQEIIHETCSPTVSPTHLPSLQPTVSPTITSINTSTTLQYEAPVSPTISPTLKFSSYLCFNFFTSLKSPKIRQGY